MEKIRYGTKDIIATLAGAVAFLLLNWLELYLIEAKILPADTFSWVQLRVVAVAVVAIFFGPISGAICGLGGDLLVNAIFDPFISYPEVLSLGLYGLLVGTYYGRWHYNRRGFTPRDFVDFNAVSVMAGIVCAEFFVPLAAFFFESRDIYESLQTGAKSVVGNSILVGIVCSVLMGVVVGVRGRRMRKEKVAVSRF